MLSWEGSQIDPHHCLVALSQNAYCFNKQKWRHPKCFLPNVSQKGAFKTEGPPKVRLLNFSKVMTTPKLETSCETGPLRPQPGLFPLFNQETKLKREFWDQKKLGYNLSQALVLASHHSHRTILFLIERIFTCLAGTHHLSFVEKTIIDLPRIGPRISKTSCT